MPLDVNPRLGGRDMTNHPAGPPRLLFVHEWWLELRDDLKMAGALFNCAAGCDHWLPDEVEHTMFERAEAVLLSAHARGAFPVTPQQIIYGIWFQPEHDWLPAVGPVSSDEWLAPLRDGAAAPDRTGLVHIVRVEWTDEDRRSDPRLSVATGLHRPNREGEGLHRRG
jgi:hypothetical protein